MLTSQRFSSFEAPSEIGRAFCYTALMEIQTGIDSYEEALSALAATGRLRQCRVVEPELNELWPVCRIDGQRAVNFSSNNYLGLAEHPQLKAAAISAIEQYGTGSGASRLVSGTSALIQELETEVARFKTTESALIFNSGYQANVALLQALVSAGDWLFLDKLNHASIVDGALLCGARWTRYRHLDWEHLERKLQKAPVDVKKWIVTDSLFSMDGDWAELPVLCDLAERYDAMLLVDEAHATGLFGETRSSGLAEAQGVSQRITLHMGTFSKGLAGFGAYVAGPDVLIQTLINRARGLIYSTALPPAVIGAALAAIRLVQSDSEPKQKLWANVAYFKPRLEIVLARHGLDCPSHSQILPIILGKRAMRVFAALLEQGYFVQGIRPPTVPEGTDRLRITLSAAHTQEQLDGLLTALDNVLAKTG